MPAQITLKVPAGIQTAAQAFQEEVASGLQQASLDVEGQAKRLAPVRTGNLRRSIGSTVAPIGGNATGVIFASAKYAPFVEYGTRPHTPPLAAIQRWASRKGLPAGAIWMAIRQKGTKPHPFMEPALEAKRGSVLQRMQQAIDAAVKRMTAP